MLHLLLTLIYLCFFSIDHNRFTPVLPGVPAYQDDPKIREYWSPFQYFSQYIDDKTFEDLAAFTNQRQLQTTGVHTEKYTWPALAIPESKCFGLKRLKCLLLAGK